MDELKFWKIFLTFLSHCFLVLTEVLATVGKIKLLSYMHEHRGTGLE